MRCLAIDHGTRRWGLAYGDDVGVAVPLPALTAADPAKRWQDLGEVVRLRSITDIVLGHPLNMDGTAGAKAREAEGVAARLRAAYGLPVHLADERLTTCEAEESVPKKERRSVRASGRVDSRAAAIFLQDFLNDRLRLP
jgi:putative Holliday junction resolvase